MRPFANVRPVRALSIAVAAAALAFTAACAPVTTTDDYAPSDGLRVDAGAVQGLNLLVVADPLGPGGTFYGAFSNRTEGDVQLTVQAPSGSEVVNESLAGQELLNFNAANQLVLDDLAGAVAGDMLPIVLTVNNEATELSLPVLSGAPAEGVDTYSDAVQG